MLSMKFFWFAKLGAANATVPTGMPTPATLIVPALLVGATGTYCLKIERLAAEIPGRAERIESPAAVGAAMPPGEAACPSANCSHEVKKRSLFFKIGPPTFPPQRVKSKRG